MKNIAILGSCQNRPIAELLSVLSPNVNYFAPTAVHRTEPDEVAEFLGKLHSFDAIITQPIIVKILELTQKIFAKIKIRRNVCRSDHGFLYVFDEQDDSVNFEGHLAWGDGSDISGAIAVGVERSDPFLFSETPIWSSPHQDGARWPTLMSVSVRPVWEQMSIGSRDTTLRKTL